MIFVQTLWAVERCCFRSLKELHWSSQIMHSISEFKFSSISSWIQSVLHTRILFSIGTVVLPDSHWLAILVWICLLVSNKFSELSLSSSEKSKSHQKVIFPGCGGDPQLPPWSAGLPQDRPPGDESLDNWFWSNGWDKINEHDVIKSLRQNKW